MTIAGLTLPELSEYDPPIAGEGSIDPMGLAAISDRLADRLVPGLRARMLRVRFVTVIAVGSVACETLADEPPADGVTTPAVAFEWLTIEGFARRLPPNLMPHGVPGSLKARTVVSRNERLSASTYLKGPSVFGFNGVYKPFAVDARVVGADLEPGPRCAELVRAWEQDQGFPGFTDAVPNTDGGRLRGTIRDQVRNALREGRCTTNPGSWLFGQLAGSLHPDNAGHRERHVLRSLVTDDEHDTRAELARHFMTLEVDLTEAETLTAIRPSCSAALGAIVDAVLAYEQFAARVDAVFRTLVAVSHSMGATPLTPAHVQQHEMVVRCARELPEHYRVAVEHMAAIDAVRGVESVLGEFAIPRTPPDLVALAFEHHERIQAQKLPNGKRPWFEPLRQGWVVRGPYSKADLPELGPWFVHPVRVAPLWRFLEDTEVRAG
jgi:hypothetical protein